jgi:L-fucose isomerase
LPAKVKKMRKIGVIGISDERESVYTKLNPLIESFTKRVVDSLKQIPGVELVVEPQPVCSTEAARAAGRRLAALGVQGTIFSMPTFGYPRLGVLASLFAPGPYLLIAENIPNQPSPAGILGLGGAMTQLGVPHQRVWLEPGSPECRKQLEKFINVAYAKNSIYGNVMGLIGGRSMGLYPMMASGIQWLREFGVDIEHLDQIEIIRLAGEVSDSTVKRAYSWISEHIGNIEINEKRNPLHKIQEQIRHYEALKRITRERQLDFIALKCHPEMSSEYVTQCLSIMLMNDPYDWDGAKTPVVCACEADQDGALTMKLLSLLSNKPSCLLDFRYFDKKNDCYLLQNCGAAPSWFAQHSEHPAENLAAVSLCPCVDKWRAGGAHFSFAFKPGTYTAARLYQDVDGYHMVITPGEALASDGRDFPEGEMNWPRTHLRFNAAQEEIINRLNCVHLHLVSGDYVEDLIELCRLLGIKPELI